MEFIGGEAHEFGAAEGRREAARLVKAQVGESLHADQWQQVVRFQNYCMQKELGRSGSNDNNDYYVEPQPLQTLTLTLTPTPTLTLTLDPSPNPNPLTLTPTRSSRASSGTRCSIATSH